jgi:hypothetical protein
MLRLPIIGQRAVHQIPTNYLEKDYVSFVFQTAARQVGDPCVNCAQFWFLLWNGFRPFVKGIIALSLRRKLAKWLRGGFNERLVLNAFNTSKYGKCWLEKTGRNTRTGF